MGAIRTAAAGIGSFISGIGRYSKFIVAILGAVSVGLTSFAADQPWVATVLAAISAISVYLVPNQAPLLTGVKLSSGNDGRPGPFRQVKADVGAATVPLHATDTGSGR